MAQKWTKSAILWPKMPQITPNFDWKCIQIVSIDFQNFVNFRQFLADFWPKNRNFFADAAKISEKKFQRKIELVLGKWSNWSINWQKCTQGYRLSNKLWISFFFLILRLPKCNKRAFFVKKQAILPQNHPLCSLRQP